MYGPGLMKKNRIDENSFSTVYKTFQSDTLKKPVQKLLNVQFYKF